MTCHRCKNSGWVWYKTSDPENSHDKELCPDCFGISKSERCDKKGDEDAKGVPSPSQRRKQ